MRIRIKPKHNVLKRTVAAIFLAVAGAWGPCETLDQKPNGIILTKHSTGNTIRLNEENKNVFAANMRIPLGSAKVNVVFDNNGNFTLKETVSMINPFGSSNSTLGYNYSCKPIEDKKSSKEDTLIKAVFIRPCEGQLYEKFPEKKGEDVKTLVGGGTVESVCIDLRDSGVTDVFASEQTRVDLGQDLVLAEVDWIMPMAYTDPYMGFGGPNTIENLTNELKEKHRGKKDVPALRAWKCVMGTSSNCFANETETDLLKNIRTSIQNAKKANADGYGLFTYESLLQETNRKTLKETTLEIDW